MLLTILRVVSGCLIIYIMGWISNRYVEVGLIAPKFLRFLCGINKTGLSISGTVAQMMAFGYLAGTLLAVKMNRADFIYGLGMTGLLLFPIIIGVIWGVWYTFNKSQ
jgi:hypothetical protein